MTSHPPQTPGPPPPDDLDVVGLTARVRDEIGRAIVGQDPVVELLLITLLARGHALLEGVPGLAKTLLVRSLAGVTSCSFARIQFTPDLMPGDITGSEVLEEDRASGQRVLRFVSGPLFANLVLADEINRTTPKTQAALLEAMQEGHVTVGGQTHVVPRPFHVFATQNPLEQEGTYPLPEAQVDRFMVRIRVEYPSADEEQRIAAETTGAEEASVRPVLDPTTLAAMQTLTRRVPAAPSVVARAVALARASRPGADPYVDEHVAWGAGPRASQFLVLGAKARCLLRGREVASAGDVDALAHPVLEHRILLSYRAQAQGVRRRDVVDHLLSSTPTSDGAL